MKKTIITAIITAIIIMMTVTMTVSASAKTTKSRIVARESISGYEISARQGKRDTAIFWDAPGYAKEEICRYHFTGKVKIIPEGKLSYNRKVSRKGKILYIERIVGVVTSANLDGKTSNGYYISYRCLKGKASKGDVIVTYCVYNPHTHWVDDVDERFDIIL